MRWALYVTLSPVWFDPERSSAGSHPSGCSTRCTARSWSRCPATRWPRGAVAPRQESRPASRHLQLRADARGVARQV